MRLHVVREIPGYPKYQATSGGTVFGPAGTALKPFVTDRGYLAVTVTSDGRRRVRRVHKLVLLAFRGEPAAGMEARHLNGDKSNNRPENLAWGTHRQNMRDLVDHGGHHLASKTHCPRGHAYDEDNTYLHRGSRSCRTCKRDTSRARRKPRKPRLLTPEQKQRKNLLARLRRAKAVS